MNLNISKKITTIILCAGKSTRMNSTLSKMLHPICGIELCLWAINLTLNYSNNDIIVVLGYQANKIKSTIKTNFSKQIKFITQKHQLGTGDAIKRSIKAIAKDTSYVIVLPGDTPLIKENSLKELYKLSTIHKPLIAMFTAKMKHAFGYGRILRNKNGNIIKIIEQKYLNYTQKNITEFNPGVYIFNYKFLVNNINKLHFYKNEYYITELIQIASKQKKSNYINILSKTINKNEALGVNNNTELTIAKQILNTRIIKSWIKKGVQFINPYNVYIDKNVKISSLVKIEPGVTLKGKTNIGSNVTIGNGSILDNMIIKNNVHILPYSICEESYINNNVIIGPFARLRPKTIIEKNVKIGNFIEIKKSIIKKGTKANHLSYIGDAEIGENSNIGAGSVTCNYDGTNKHKAILKKGVFLGSNSTLISPITINKHAYIAAGSVLNKNVPKYSLAISRSKQINKKHYVKKIIKK